jgi:hypothetical protein
MTWSARPIYQSIVREYYWLLHYCIGHTTIKEGAQWAGYGPKQATASDVPSAMGFGQRTHPAIRTFKNPRVVMVRRVRHFSYVATIYYHKLSWTELLAICDSFVQPCTNVASIINS